MSVPATVESLIADKPLSAHVATSVDDRPHVAPVWYGYRDGVLYFMTGGKKLANVRRNPRVGVSIEDARGGDVRWNVTLLGTATVTDDPERMNWASSWIYDAYETGNVEDDGPREREADSSAAEHESAEEATAPTADGVETREETADGSGDASEETAVDGGYALVEVTVGSASWQRYE